MKSIGGRCGGGRDPKSWARRHKWAPRCLQALALAAGRPQISKNWPKERIKPAPTPMGTSNYGSDRLRSFSVSCPFLDYMLWPCHPVYLPPSPDLFDVLVSSFPIVYFPFVVFRCGNTQSRIVDCPRDISEFPLLVLPPRLNWRGGW